MTPPAVLKRRSEGTKRTEISRYPAEISGTWYHFGRNRSRNRIRKNGRISGQPEPEPDIRYIPSIRCLTCLPLLPPADISNAVSDLEALVSVSNETNKPLLCRLLQYMLHAKTLLSCHVDTQRSANNVLRHLWQ